MSLTEEILLSGSGLLSEADAALGEEFPHFQTLARRIVLDAVLLVHGVVAYLEGKGVHTCLLGGVEHIAVVLGIAGP
jgi:hypothetical protein